MKPTRNPFLITSSLLLLAATASAQTWDGNGTPNAGGNWSTAVNWNPDTVPTSGNTANLDDTGADRTIIYDAGASGTLGTLNFNQSSAFANILDIQKSLTVTNAITLGASSGTERISIGSSSSATFVLTPTGGLTLNPGGELVMTATGNGVSGYFFGNTGGSGTTTIQGGTLTVAPTTGTSTGTSAANTHAGSLTMTSGSLIIDNATGVADRRLTVSGTVNISGGAISSTKVGSGGFLTFGGSSITFNPTSFDTGLNMSIDRSGAQSLSTNKTLGTIQFRGTGVKTLTSSASGTGVAQIQLFDNHNSTANSQTTLKLGSDLTSTASASMPAAQNFGNTHEGGRIDLGIDTNGFTLDLTAGATSGAWTPNKGSQVVSTVEQITNTVWSLSGSGVIKANRFNFNTAGVTTNVAANTVLTAAGGDSTATDLSGTGTIDAASTFRYSGAAAFATPATLASNRAIGKLDVTSGTLKLLGTLNAGGSTTVSGGTLIVPLTASLYGGTTGSWTAANLNVLSGGTLALNVGGAGEFATTDVTTLLTNLASSSDNGLRAGATLGFDTTTAAGNTFTVADTLADTTGSSGGSLAIHKLGTNTLVLSGSNSYTGLTTVTAGVLRVSNSGALGGTAAGTVVNGTFSGTLGTVLDLNGVSIGSGESLSMASGNLAGDSRVTLRTVGTTTNTWAGGVLLTGSKIVQFSANTGGQLEISGPVTHSSFTGALTLRGGGTGTLSGGISLGSSTVVTLNDATSVWNINTSGNTWGNTNVFNGTLVLGANDALPTTTSLNLGSSTTSGTLKLNGRSQTVAGLTNSTTTTTNKIVNGSATVGTLTVNNSTANAFAGVLGGTGTDENNFSLTKSGAGTLTLSGANTYTGTTTVTGGSLALDVSASLASAQIALNGGNFNVSAVSGGYTLGTGQQLTGSGSVTGTVEIDGTLAIGNSPGTMTFEDNLGLNVGSISNFEINGFTSGNYDLALAAVAGSQAVAFNGGTLNLLFQSGFNTEGTVKIFDFETYAGTGFTAINTSGLASGYSASFDAANGVVTVVPEPRTALLGGLGLLALLRRRRLS
jgi:autotransporter-associated beta strand protein